MAIASKALAERKVVPVGARPHRHIGYVGEVDRVWVSNSGSSTLSILDGTSGDPVATLEVGRSPQHFVVDDTLLGYVALEGADAVAVVDARTNQMVTRVALPAGSKPTSILPAFEQRRIFVLNHGSGTVSVVDLTRHAVTQTLTVGQGPYWGQPHSRSVGKYYVANADSNDVTIIDDATTTVLATVPVGKHPIRNAIYRERGEVYTSNVDDGTISAISIASNRVTATVKVGVQPFRMVACEEKNGRDELWVLCRGSEAQPEGVIAIVDGTAHRLIKTLPVGPRPINWLFKGKQTYVSSAAAKTLTIVDLDQAEIVGQVSLGAAPEDQSFSNEVFAKNGQLFIANREDSVTILG